MEDSQIKSGNCYKKNNKYSLRPKVLIKKKKNIINKFIIFSLLIIVIIIDILFKSNTTICLCVIAKNENLYVREFVEYYFKIGYNKIFIYDNNDKDGETFDTVIKDYIKKNFVKIPLIGNYILLI